MSRGAVIVFALIVSVSGITAEFNIDVQDILDFYRNQGNVELSHSVEDYVALIRDIIIERITCGDLDNGQNCECLSFGNILKIVKGRYNDSTSTEVLNQPTEQFRKKEQLAFVSVIILNYFLRHENTCNNNTILLGYIGDCQIYNDCWTKVSAQFLNEKNDTITDEIAVEKMLRQVKYVYEPLPNRKCVNAEKILEGVEEREHNPLMLPKEVLISMRILRTILYGECIDVEDSASDFLDDIFLHYGENCNRILTMTGFAKLLDDLQMQRPSQHLDHEMNLSFCNKSAWKHLSRTTPMPLPTEEKNDTSEYFATGTNSGSVHTKGDKDLYEALQPSNEYEKTDVKIVTGKTSTNTNTQDKNLYLKEQNGESTVPMGGSFEVVENGQRTGSSRRTRHTPIVREEPEHKNLANECLSPEELVQKFLTNKDVITSDDFLQMCPALVQQAVSGVCKFRAENPKPAQNLTSENSTVSVTPSKKSFRTLLAFGAITVITLLSLIGAFMIPILNKPLYDYVSDFFLGLAFSTMLGDVLIHIMPQYLGLHVHREGESEDSFEVPKYTIKQLTLAVAVYIIYLLQAIFNGIFKKPGHGHSHEAVDSIALKNVKSTSDESMVSSNQSITDDIEKEKKEQKTKKMFDSAEVFCGFTTSALVIIAADTIHNFVDGAAISVAFATSEKDGLLSSVAVLFHEIPHEMADFVMLTQAGLPFKKALIVNFISGITGYGGMIIGELMSDEAWRVWLQLVTGALFLYVSMGEMLPELKAPINKKWLKFILKQIGIVVGIVLMVCITIFENSI
ncbi:zinc transporter ZIP10-like [Uloborus diversus]|uniref:zinc transporter ZIP10-like n=1 Tax=Uloborus diversus TaxID=327109 RepID=UPI0024090429|nr:zinc transporter ZIP10-like [Uloborus diversus]